MTGTLGDALLQSLLAGGAGTTVGALPVLLVRRIGPRLESTMAGFSAGVMLAASFVALLLPALELVADGSGGAFSSWPVMAGVCAGAIGIDLLHRVLPHEHFQTGTENAARARIARVWLFAIALSLHNLPEGLAVGVAVASGDEAVSLPVTLAIGVQNAPEGLIVAVAFVTAGYRRATALLVTALTGLVEVAGAALGFGAVQLVTAAMPAALGFAAGAMVYVVSHEIIPESHGIRVDGHADRRSPLATFGVVGGILAMLQVDGWLG